MEYGSAVKRRMAVICEHPDRVSAANADRAVGSRPHTLLILAWAYIIISKNPSSMADVAWKP